MARSSLPIQTEITKRSFTGGPRPRNKYFDQSQHLQNSKTIDTLGRYIILKAEIKDKIYVLINIYAPNKDKDSFTFFADLLARLKNENLDEEENIIIGGDFNCPLNTILDKKGGILTPRKSVVSIINSIQGDLDLIDIWRVKNPDTKKAIRGVKIPQ